MEEYNRRLQEYVTNYRNELDNRLQNDYENSRTPKSESSDHEQNEDNGWSDRTLEDNHGRPPSPPPSGGGSSNDDHNSNVNDSHD